MFILLLQHVQVNEKNPSNTLAKISLFVFSGFWIQSLLIRCNLLYMLGVLGMMNRDMNRVDIEDRHVYVSLSNP
jgi:hypothetical protein